MQTISLAGKTVVISGGAVAIEWELHGTWPQAARLNLVALSFDASMKPVEKLRDQGTEIELSHFDLHNTDQISGWFPNCS